MTLRYAVGQRGWAAGPYWLDPGVVVDTALRPDIVFHDYLPRLYCGRRLASPVLGA